MPIFRTKRDVTPSKVLSGHSGRFCLNLTLLVILGCANGPSPVPSATWKRVLAPAPVVVTGVALDEHVIRRSLLKFSKVDEDTFALVPVKSEQGTLSLSSRDASGKFVTVHFSMRNDDVAPTHVFPLLFQGADLIDSEGKAYPVDKDALAFAASIPDIAPGNENSFYVFYDVPKGAHPSAVSFRALETILVFSH